MADGTACAFIGSHNVTDFALNGHNGEMSVLLEGPRESTEFQVVREHIAASKEQSVPYTPDMKEAFAWWTREFLDGWRAEVKLPADWDAVRTILIFAQAERSLKPRRGDAIYFEIPAGIQPIETLRTETHLFLFENLPSDPNAALRNLSAATSSYTCKTLGADNKQGNRELSAQWQVLGNQAPTFLAVSGGVLRPSPGPGLQQARAEVESAGVDRYEYSFNSQSDGWEPQYAESNAPRESELFLGAGDWAGDQSREEVQKGWRLVKGLIPRASADPSDSAALKRANPESGAFLVVSLRRRKRYSFSTEEGNV
jgi:hypothetical protein